MGLYKYDNGVLVPIAGRGKAEYGASTTRNVTWTNAEAIAVGGSVPFSAVFDVPMPDANYEVNWTCSASALHPVIDAKTASGFTGHAYRLVSPAVDIGNGVINFTAFRLYTDLEYNELLHDTDSLIKNTVESGVVNQCETIIHSQRYNKVVYTVNEDGTIDIEVIQRPDTYTGLSIGFVDVKAGETYKLTGGLSANERIELKNMDYSAWTNNTVNKAVSSPIVDTNVDTFMPNADATLRVYLRIDASGNTGNVGTIKPMIRFASFLDDTFIPYAKTNRLLTVETDELFANAAMLKGMTEITSQTDLNDLTTIGEYFKSSTSIYVTNAPTGIDSETSAIFRIKVENGSGSTTFIQTIVKDDGTTYKRGYNGTTWSTWAEFASSSSVSGLDTRLTTAETDIDNLETAVAGKAPTSHASTETTYGVASTTDYGHVKTSTGITNSSGTISVAYGTTAGTACEGNDSRLSDARTPTAHATNATTYGGGDGTNYGHVKLSDNYTSSGGAASASVGASSKAVYDSYMVKTNQDVIATRQANLTASRRYELGDQFIYNNELYKVTATAGINKNAAINTGSGGNASKADNITTQIGKFDQKVLGHAVGATAIPISNYHDVDVACIYTLNGTSFTWLFHIPNYFISQLGNNYRFLRQGDSQSIIILGVTSNLVTLNTAMFDGANVASNIDLYVYST